MSVKMRQMVEREIATALVDSALAAGYTVTVFNGEEDVLKQSSSQTDILAAMFSTDDDRLFLWRDGQQVGWVLFIYGNDGPDVISDYTTNLEHIMAEANLVSAKYSD